jgi:chromosome segregation ATPase
MATNPTDNKDLVSRLKDAGEDALQKLGDVPGGKKALEALNGLRERLDDLQKRMNRVDELEKRVEALEKAAKKPAPRKRTTTSSSSASKPTETKS